MKTVIKRKNIPKKSFEISLDGETVSYGPMAFFAWKELAEIFSTNNQLIRGFIIKEDGIDIACNNIMFVKDFLQYKKDLTKQRAKI